MSIDAENFDRLTRSLWSGPTGDRRAILRLLFAGATGALVAPVGTQPAEAACRKNGKGCKRGNQCCSGLCKGPKGKKNCRSAPSRGICTIESQLKCQAPDATACGPGCDCYLTTKGGAFCGLRASEDCGCNDDDCPGEAVCVQALVCCGAIGAPRACVEPCPTPD